MKQKGAITAMDDISTLPLQISGWLANIPSLSGISFTTQYPSQKKQIPLRKAMVAVGIERIIMEDKYVENKQGEKEKQEDCRSANIRMSLGIYVPYKESGQRCHEVFCTIIERLTYTGNIYILGSGCGAVKADRDTDAFVLQGYADITRDFYQET